MDQLNWSDFFWLPFLLECWRKCEVDEDSRRCVEFTGLGNF